MTNKNNCNHTIGYVVSYGCEGDPITDFIGIDNVYMETAHKLKSDDGGVFSFCPDCGENLKGVLDTKIKQLQAEQEKIKKENEAKRKKEEEHFNKKVSESASKTGLENLPEEGSFVVIFHPTKSSFGKDVFLGGPKNHILRNCVHINKHKSTPDELLVKNIYKIPSDEALSSFLQRKGFETKDGKFFKKTESARTRFLWTNQSGVVYVNEETVGSFDETCTKYIQLTICELGKYLDDSFELEPIELKILNGDG